MVLVVSPVAATDVPVIGDELHSGQSLDLLEAELDLIAQPQRCAMAVSEWLALHLVGEHRAVVPHGEGRPWPNHLLAVRPAAFHQAPPLPAGTRLSVPRNAATFD